MFSVLIALMLQLDDIFLLMRYFSFIRYSSLSITLFGLVYLRVKEPDRFRPIRMPLGKSIALTSTLRQPWRGFRNLKDAVNNDFAPLLSFANCDDHLLRADRGRHSLQWPEGCDLSSLWCHHKRARLPPHDQYSSIFQIGCFREDPSVDYDYSETIDGGDGPARVN